MNIKWLKILLLFCCMAEGINAATKKSMTTDNDSIKTVSSPAFIYEQEKEWEPAGKDIVRQIMGYGNQVMLVKVKFLKKGAIGSAHAHSNVQTTYVVSGKFEFTINGEKKIVEAGDGVYVASDLLHGCVCLEPGMLIDCFAPMRDDFLK